MRFSKFPRGTKLVKLLLLFIGLALILYLTFPTPESFPDLLERLARISPLMLPITAITAIIMVWRWYSRGVNKRLGYCFKYCDVPLYGALFSRGEKVSFPIAQDIEHFQQIGEKARLDIDASLRVFNQHKDLYPRNLSKLLKDLPGVLRAYSKACEELYNSVDWEVRNAGIPENMENKLKDTLFHELGKVACASYRDKFEKEVEKILPKLKPLADALQREEALKFLHRLDILMWEHVGKEALGALPLHYKKEREHGIRMRV